PQLRERLLLRIRTKPWNDEVGSGAADARADANGRFRTPVVQCFLPLSAPTSHSPRIGREATPSRRELPLPRHPRLVDLDVGDRIRVYLVGIAFQDCEIRFLAVFERAEAFALSELAGGVDRHGAGRVVKRNGLVGTDDGIVYD